MKNKNKTIVAIEGFKAVGFMRKVRDKISSDIAEMSFEQITAYFAERKIKLTNK